MKFLLDTNIVVPLEPKAEADIAPNTPMALEFHRLAGNTGNEVYVHPYVEFDLDRDKDAARAAMRRAALPRYNMLKSPPAPLVVTDGTLGSPDEGTND
jgi:hypothetical protein